MVFQGKAYNEIRIGEHISAALTITETHLVLAAGLNGDFNPLHINQQFAEKSQFGSRILHGVATSAIMGGLPGMYSPVQPLLILSTTAASRRRCGPATP